MKNSENCVLYIAYPLLPVSEESCGGAEQMLLTIEREMAARGRCTAVAASDGSTVSGELISTGKPAAQSDSYEQREAEHARTIIDATSKRRFALVHDHSGSFFRNAAKVNAPMLTTLHLPRPFYNEALFASVPSNVYFNCVSKTQMANFADLPRMLGVVSNGIEVERFPFARRKDAYLLWLGRICPEKAPHLAIDIAERTGMPLVIAGQVYPFSYHQQYFDREVMPRIERSNGRVQFIERPGFVEKTELLRGAKALVVTSLAPETSSLVALEAQACGTPVVAFRNGALHEVVKHGHTGFTVKTMADMLAAVHDVEHIWPDECRHHVEENFSSVTMANGYERLYEQIAHESRETMLMAA